MDERQAENTGLCLYKRKMKIELTKFLNSISFALDYVEGEYLRAAMEHAEDGLTHVPKEYAGAKQLLRVAPNHAKRVAVLTNRMAFVRGMNPDTVYAVTHAALLHDSALSEYLTDEFSDSNAGTDAMDLKSHCLAGEKIIRGLPFYDKIQETVLYHHERPDGKGPFGKTAGQIPVGAEMIHLADDLDTRFSLDSMDEQKNREICAFISKQKGRLYSDEAAEAFLAAADPQLLQSITGQGSKAVLDSLIPSVEIDIPVELLRRMSLIFADITDYKSHFTWRHSLGIAEKAEAMGHYYGYSKEICDKLYIAGALHDIGKLFISNDILEKPGKLTGEEYQEIQNHAMGTWKLLKGIGGLEDITSWAANHHEKLDGSGYPYGKKADELSPNDRLLACLDIYQALVEERPYKAGLSHEEAMGILNKMGDKGQLDAGILADLDRCFARTQKETPLPAEPEKKAEPSEGVTPGYTGEAWRCPVCGYIYEGELPDDFICPRCEQPGSIFERIQ